MCIYCPTKNYRKIYQEHFGPIPKDQDGRTYDIHHKDGDHSNNSPENLEVLSIKEHYAVHYSQGDWMACWRMKQRMDLTPEEISFLSKKSAMDRVNNKTHNLLGPETNKKRVDAGTHHFLGGNNPSKRKVKEGTHHWLGPETNKKRVDAGTHNFMGDNNPSRKSVANGTHHMLMDNNPSRQRVDSGTHNFQVIWTCPHCSKTGKGTGLYARWHGDNCRTKSST